MLLARAKQQKPEGCCKPLTVVELKYAELQVVRLVQEKAFPVEKNALQCGKKISTNSFLYRLDSYLNGHGIMEVGSRTSTYFLIMPKDHHVSQLIMRHNHDISSHSGKEYVMSLIRRQFWIIGARTLVRRVLRKCILCRRWRSEPMRQRMANLPVDRLATGEPPFNCVGADICATFTVKHSRSKLKRYGYIFTCLVVRAIHIEVVYSLKTDSFINALIRFVCRRGNVKIIRSDNGTSFVGADKELRAAIKQWNQNKISKSLSH